MAHKRILSFKHAGRGIWTAFKEEPHLKFHFGVAILILALGWYFHLTRQEWMGVILVIGLVIGVELTNTAIETVVDSFTSDYHPAAKRAKDVSAGAVLIMAIMAISIGIIIFLPHLLNLLGDS